MALNSIEKNLPDLLAFFSGKMPNYIYTNRPFVDIPVFCFHGGKPKELEQSFEFLKLNGYRTLSADELLSRRLDKNYRNNGKEIVLTFDDGLASVWTVVFPLLQKFEFKIISFVLPGLINEADSVGPNISNCSPQQRNAVSQRDFSTQPLCTWPELQHMQQSGLVDVESHGMYHALISVGPKIIDFISPEFDTHNYANIHIPIYKDAQGNISRNKVLGHVVYQNKPRLSGQRGYLDNSQIRQQCADFVEKNGAARFFQQTDWRRVLVRHAQTLTAKVQPGVYESIENTKTAMWQEFKESKLRLEQRLHKTIRHFCFPWFAACALSLELASEAGYEGLHLGITAGFRVKHSSSTAVLITRLQQEYLGHLPGRNSYSLLGVLNKKLRSRQTHTK